MGISCLGTLRLEIKNDILVHLVHKCRHIFPLAFVGLLLIFFLH